ncbi:MAG TPA: amidohydrolase family protein [Bryobacteraceae bacterium]|nr:amidohydrolase family protein [Bryobacteraceae bacterium]
MKIDLFTHFFPKRFFDEFVHVGAAFKDMGKRVQNIPSIHDLEARFRVMDEFDDYCQFLSLPSPPLEVMAGPDRSPLLARIANDGLAELVTRHPNRFPGFTASLPLNNPEESLKEFDRAVSQLGARGIQIFTNINGKPLDAPEFAPLFEEAARRDLPIWMHPARGPSFADYATEDKSLYEIWWTLGWPYETSVAMSRMVFSGLLDRLPGLKIITHHMGGMIPYFEGRAGYGWDQLGTRTSDLDYVALLRSLKKRPLDYFRMFYADTALFGALAGTRCGLEFFGVDHVLFASDAPFEPKPGLYIRETIRVIESLGLTADQKDHIYRNNALRLLNLETTSQSSAL